VIDARSRSQFLRYATVGLTSNVLMYLAYLGLTAVALGHKSAMTLVYLAGTFLSFFANRSWSFAHRGASRVALARYVAAYLFGYGLNWTILWVGVDRFRFPHQIVQAGAICVVAIGLFLLHKFWVFRPDTGADAP